MVTGTGYVTAGTDYVTAGNDYTKKLVIKFNCCQQWNQGSATWLRCKSNFSLNSFWSYIWHCRELFINVTSCRTVLETFVLHKTYKNITYAAPREIRFFKIQFQSIKLVEKSLDDWKTLYNTFFYDTNRFASFERGRKCTLFCMLYRTMSRMSDKFLKFSWFKSL